MSVVDGSKAANTGWHVFNDFLVKAITEDEALSFAGGWKVCVQEDLYYQI
jgi:PAB-dependent poly(A)-specific ribonuclease subunit 2